ncbi:hypothetical protein [Streptomyces sp. 8ZJF_21]|uniref:hypothetical protein n=1 Tax=Streptomyces sp. 8ZJF_21 TaxID=2903141 RepID=UPI001E58F74F|nr:hypothetical protein [Streptomyces sp. 8ZJF_21]MCD9589670.1 hypothetical protein [Streptomyces sp. 8ZJF_21]
MTTGVLAGISPQHGWEWKPLWAVLQRSKEAGNPGLPPLSVFLDAGVVPRSSREDNHNQLGEDLSKYLVVRDGDVVFNKLRTWQGGLGVSRHEGIVSPAYFVCRPNAETDSRFIHYLLKSKPYLAELVRISKWMPPSQFDTPWENLRKLPLLLPGLDEQRRIADFLDAETARIDAIVSMRNHQLILAEQRFEQIVDGVVLGDRDSLREIGYEGGAKWGNGKIARLFAVIPGYAFPSRDFVAQENGTPLLRGINVAPGAIDWNVETMAWDLGAHPIDQRFHLRCDDLVIGMDRPWINSGSRIALVRDSDLPCLLLQRVACIRSHGPASTRYLRWVLASRHFRIALEGETTGISVPHISGEQIKSFSYMLPPPDDERQLAALLERHDGLRAEYSAMVNRQLELLTERRQALITAAVTGQLDVTTARPTHDRDH